MNPQDVLDTLLEELRPLEFGPPVSHVYNPLEYAQEPYRQYLARYAKGRKEIILLGMNPGPWGMAQTGVPFGEINAVKDWLRIEARVGTPPKIHPKRPVEGFHCTRSEVSGRRLWGWARKTCKTPERFFARFFVANYCPVLFIESSGRNRTPNNLRAAERRPLFTACDNALRQTIRWLRPRYVIGVGNFAEGRARHALSDFDLTIGRITHPSPANPNANRGWDSIIERELSALGIRI